MPVPEAVAKAKLKRFSAYVPYPDDEALARLTLTLMALALDAGHAELMAQWLERTLHFFPKIVDLHDAVAAVSAAEIRPPKRSTDGNDPYAEYVAPWSDEGQKLLGARGKSQ